MIVNLKLSLMSLKSAIYPLSRQDNHYIIKLCLDLIWYSLLEECELRYGEKSYYLRPCFYRVRGADICIGKSGAVL